MYSSELEQRAQSVSNMLSTARETRPWSTENSEWPLDLTQGWDRWAEREVKRWSKKRVQSLSITMLGQLKSKSTFFLSSTLLEKEKHIVHLHVDGLPLHIKGKN